MQTLTLVLLFILGASVGSFVNVVSLRYGTGLSPWKGSSKCFSCGSLLHWYELIPIFSYLGLGGRCRHCRTKLSPQYFLVELASGVAVASIFYLYGLTTYFLLLTSFYFVLILIFLYDLHHKIIPDSFLAIFGLLSLFFSYFILHTSYFGLLTGLFLVPLPFLLIWFVSSGRYIGFGDIKFMAVMGLLFGWREGFSAVLISFWIGFVCVSFIFLTRLVFKLFHLRDRGKQLTMKSELPFAPFLVVGTLLALFLNVDLISNVLVQ